MFRMIKRIIGLIFFTIMWTMIIVASMESKVQTVEVVKEVLVEVPMETIIEVTPENAIEMTSMDRELISRMVWREGGTCSIECQAAIASVAINRANNGYWGSTLREVINAPGQFHVASLIDYTTPQEISSEMIILSSIFSACSKK